ncbi:hypothetical protein YDYSY3_57740 [Paenibacillus chitinolyticus]|uniref:hypothetical protein n=1 Tax=Paenibacillus chitinolyticus TaxID=79263 RepID=UPI0026E4B114|nr:hypothetical protein [Paenibacillus chitinolyticus]GKS14774.1 hypothetical protein YDYSY3_57740 [Paenibacillus chitinolyticus]
MSHTFEYVVNEYAGRLMDRQFIQESAVLYLEEQIRDAHMEKKDFMFIESRDLITNNTRYVATTDIAKAIQLSVEDFIYCRPSKPALVTLNAEAYRKLRATGKVEVQPDRTETHEGMEVILKRNQEAPLELHSEWSLKRGTFIL